MTLLILLIQHTQLLEMLHFLAISKHSTLVTRAAYCTLDIHSLNYIQFDIQANNSQRHPMCSAHPDWLLSTSNVLRAFQWIVSWSWLWWTSVQKWVKDPKLLNNGVCFGNKSLQRPKPQRRCLTVCAGLMMMQVMHLQTVQEENKKHNHTKPKGRRLLHTKSPSCLTKTSPASLFSLVL